MLFRDISHPMKPIFTFLILVPQLSFSQNLVPNPSFEEYTSCPWSGDLVTYAEGWWDWIQSPDYFHTCAEGTEVGVPLNQFGYQQPATGEGYIGLITYYSVKQVYREVAVAELISPLEVGEDYFVSFRVSPTVQLDSDNGVIHLFSNNIGIKFYNAIEDTSESFLDFSNSADLFLDEIITDTLGWHTISGQYLASEPFTHIAIGNFFSNEETDTVEVNSMLNFGAYFYVDDICVNPSETCNISNSDFILKQPTIKYFPNPVDDYLIISLGSSEVFHKLQIINTYGQVVLETPLAINLSNTTIETIHLSNGCYILSASGDQHIIKKKFLVQHK